MPNSILQTQKKPVTKKNIQEGGGQFRFYGSAEGIRAISEIIWWTMDYENLTYASVGEAAGCSGVTVSKLAHGETLQPRYSTVMNIMEALGYEIAGERDKSNCKGREPRTAAAVSLKRAV